MYGLLYSAIFTGLTWFLKTVVIKFVLPAGLWYFLDIMQFPSGFSMILSAYLLRFMVRRVPFLG